MTDLMKSIKSICEPIEAQFHLTLTLAALFISLITLAPLLMSLINIFNSLC